MHSFCLIAVGLRPTFSWMAGIHIDTTELAAVLRRNAEAYAVQLGPEEIGRVLEAGDGVAQVDGLPGVMAEEMLVFPHDVFGMALNLQRRHIGTVLFGDFSRIKQGDMVKRTCKVLQVPVGAELLGRVVTPLGNPIDGRGPIGPARHGMSTAMRRASSNANRSACRCRRGSRASTR